MEKFRPLVVTLVVLLVLSTSDRALGAKSKCNMTDKGLMACMPSIVKSKTPLKPPSAKCCSALKKADLRCLCGYKDSQLLKSLPIDLELAMDLPVKCKITQSSPCK